MERVKSKIYIDSVPPGANVYIVTLTGDRSSDGKPVGATPLVLDPSASPSMQFALVMRMESYSKLVATIPEMKGWIKEFKMMDNVWRLGAAGPEDLGFECEVSKVRIAQTLSGGISALGPYHTFASRYAPWIRDAFRLLLRGDSAVA